MNWETSCDKCDCKCDDNHILKMANLYAFIMNGDSDRPYHWERLTPYQHNAWIEFAKKMDDL